MNDRIRFLPNLLNLSQFYNCTKFKKSCSQAPGSGEFFLALVFNLFWWSIEHLEWLGAVVVTRGAVLPRQFELLKSTKNANVLWIVLFTVHLFIFVLFCFHTHLLSKFSEKSQSVFTDFPCPVCAAC